MKTILLLAFALLSATPPAPVQTPASSWSRYPLGGRFSVLLPAASRYEKGEATTPQSGPFTTHLWIAQNGDEIYVQGWVDYLPTYNFDIQAEIRANRDNFVNGMKGRLISSEPWNFGDYPGMEFTAEMPGTPSRDVRSRIVVIGRRPYMMAVLTPAGSDRSGNVFRFLASLQIIDNR